ncbi:unnamed protein product [Acanthoscelides obtectus]|uniref:Uncharacterized protein n=1 Tax=Acanthoscelides obtectus TaxID=200917 RepID=A0A9P0Q1R1_ACAOB|nr:unnamed protein product [Acanthoscelides obtectus]CAK1622464.1 hypothetical protein AOBTE_LOCUS1500 [Acanthoscelides obtectus]
MSRETDSFANKKYAFTLVSPKQLLPSPVTTQKNRIQTRKKGKSAIITSSPYKEELEKELQETQQMEQLKVKRNIDRQTKKEEKQKIIEQKQKLMKKKQQNRIRQKGKRPRHESTAESDDEDDTSCLYCSGLYSESVEGWINYIKCNKWAHCGCADVEDDDNEAHVHLFIL